MRFPLCIPLLQSTCLIATLMFLSSCAPTPAVAPSAALKEELQQIRQQQQDQAEQLQLLTRQMTLFQQAMGIEKIKPTATDPLEALIFELPESPEDESTEKSFTPSETPQIVLAPEVSSYLAAFSHLAGGRAEAAEGEFQRFLTEFPDHQHAPNARYWLAQAQVTLNKTDPATSNLRRIIIDPQAQFKAPAAMRQLAIIYRQQGFNRQADDIVEQLRISYPDSPEAQQLFRDDTSQRNSDPSSQRRGNQ